MSIKERVLSNAKQYCRYEYLKLTYTLSPGEKENEESNTIVVIMN